MKKLALLVVTLSLFATSALANLTSITWNSVNGGTNATRTYTVNAGAAITNIVATTVGTTFAAAGCRALPALPAGLTIANTTPATNGVCTISGTPTGTSRTQRYLIVFRTTGTAPQDSMSTLTLTVGPITNLDYSSKYARFTQNVAIESMVPTIFGAPESYAISPDINALTGLTFNTSTGAISGTPTILAVDTTYTITATQGTFTTTQTFRIGVQAQSDFATWRYVKPLTIDPTALSLTGDVRNFPMLVRLTSAHADVFAQSLGSLAGATATSVTGGGGADLRFTDSTGLVDLPFHIERWNSVSQTAEIWVTLPRVPQSGASTIRMWWGKSGQTTTSSGGAAFSTGNNFQAVWHMNANGTGNEAEATANGFTATQVGAPTNNTSGMVGLARTFTNPAAGSAATQYFSVEGTVSSVLNFAQNSNYTLSSWVQMPASPSTNRVIVGKGDNQFALQVGNNSGAAFEAAEYQATGLTSSNGWHAVISPASAVVANQWAHVMGVRAGGADSLYVNGNLVASNPNSLQWSGGQTTGRNLTYNFAIGSMRTGTAPNGTPQRGWVGSMDELQMSNINRDRNWAKLSFETQKAAAAVVALGASVETPDLLLSGPSYSAPTVSYVAGTAITPNVLTVTGSVDTVTVSPALPAGLSLNPATGDITGTPTAYAPAGNYTVTVSNDSGFVTTIVNLAVTVVAPTSVTYSTQAAVYTVGTAITANNAVVVGLADTFTVAPALPAGLTLNPATGAITGTPTDTSSIKDYVLTAANDSGSVIDSITILVRPAIPASVTYAPDTTTYFTGVAVNNVPIVLATGPVVVDSFAVTSGTLPTGLSIDKFTGAITGTPTLVAAAANVTVTAYNITGTRTKVLRFTISGPPTLSLSEGTITYEGGLAAPILISSTTTGTIVSWSISPSLPAGLSFDTTKGTISGSPSAASPATDYVVTVTNPGGSALDTVNITVTAAEDYTAWTGLKTFNLNTTVAAAGIASAQSNFPALVRLSSAHAAIFSAANAAGNDVRFSKPDGTRLAYEIDRWSFAPGDTSAAIWVLLDTVLASSTTPVRIHYGNGGASSKSNGNRVFNAANGYIGVWHMGNPVGGDAQTGIRPNSNSTSGVNDATPTNLTGGWVTKPGIIGLSDTLPGTGTIRLGTATGFNLGSFPVGTIPAGNATLSGWMAYGVAAASIWQSFATMARDTVFATANAAAVGTSGTGSGRIGFQVAATSNTTWQSSANNTWAQNGWLYVSTSIRNGLANDSLYVNGAFNMPNTATEQSLGDVARPFNFIGKNFIAPDATYRGKVDEVRMSNVSRTSGWTKLEYKNQKPAVTPIADLTYSAPSYSFVEEAPITPVAAPMAMGTVTRYAISPALPAGLTFNTATGGISGTVADASASQAYTVTAFGDSAWSTTASFDLAITAAPPAGLDYAADSISARVGLEITPNAPSFTGTINTFAINPPLPSGLSMSTTTGVIVGIPLSASASTQYEIIATGPNGLDTAFVVIAVAAADEDYATWANNRNITLNTSATGSNVAGTVTGFPVLIRLGAAESAIFSQTLAMGADVRFTKANGVTRLPHEIASWDDVAKTAEIWVKVDSVKGNNASQAIKMFWGKVGAADSSSGAQAFSTGFANVWHLGNAAGTDPRPNAIAGGNPATPTNFPGGYQPTAGVIGTADSLRGGPGGSSVAILANDRLTLGTIGTSYTTGFTFSAWLYPTKQGSGTAYYVASNNTSSNPGSGSIVVGHNGANAGVKFRTRNAADNANEGIINSPGAPGELNGTNSWRHVVFTKNPAGVNNGSMNVYLNGQLLATNFPTAPSGGTLTPNNINTVSRTMNFLGSSNPGAAFADSSFAGLMDEARLANAARSADWAKLEFESQKALQTLTDIGQQPPTLAYAPDSVNAMQNVAIATITPAVTGTGVTYTGALPTGLVLNPSTGVITGTPTVPTATAKFTITATNGGGSVTDSLFITVNAAPPIISYTNPPTYLVGTAVDTLAPVSNTGGPITGYTISPDLNAATGLSFNMTTGAITGTPTTVAVTAGYTIVATGAGGTDTAVVIITVNPAVPTAPVVVTPVQDAPAVPLPLVVRWNNQATPIMSYQFQGSSDSTFASVGLDTTVADTSLTVFSAPYASRIHIRVRATNVSGTGPYSTVRSFTTIAAAPSISYASPKVYTVGAPIVPLAPDTTGTGPITGYSINPSINGNTGLSFNVATGVVFGTPTLTSAAVNYTIVATGPGGTDTSVVSIATSNELPPAITYANAAVFVKGTAITPLTVDTTGSGSGPIDSFTVAPALPAGLALAKLTGTISGNPSVVAAATDYLVTAHGLGGIDTETVNITVNDIAPVIAYNSPKTYVTGTAIDTLSPLSTGGAVVTYSLLDSLPTGLVISAATGKITGTPTTGAAAADFRVLASNTGGLDTATINVTIHGAPSITTQPHDSTVISGGSVGFTVAASASASGGTLTYQWKKGGVDLSPGGTGTTYSPISGATIADTGAYTVVVTSTLNATTVSTTSNVALLRVNVAPAIATAPHDSTVVSGANASFTVAAAAGPGTSAGTLSYQWRKGATNLTNTAPFSNVATATLTVTGATIADTSGLYNVVITRTLGTPATTTTTTSGFVALRVSTVPVIGSVSDDTTVVSGANASFTVAATAQGALSYQWRKNGANVTTGTGGTTATYSITGAAIADTGSYTVVVTSTLNGIAASVTSSAALLRVNVAPTIATAPHDSTILSGANASFTVAGAAGPGTSAGSLSYQWRKGTTNLTNTAPFSNVATATLTVTGATIADTAGNLNVVITRTLGTPATTTTVTSGNVALRVNTAPVITSAVHDTTAISGANVSFTVGATAQGALTYQWRKNGANVTTGTGGTTATYAITGVAIGDTGTYTVVVTSTLNGSVATTTTATGGVLRVNVAPTIATAPHDSTVVSGAGVSFSVVAGTGPGSSAGTLSYQWRKVAANVTVGTGGTTATYAIAAAAITDTSGLYNVVITRTLNGTTTSVTSGNVALRVNTAPVITTQVRDTTVVSGGPVSFTVAATAQGALSYQWRKSGTNVTTGTGGTTATYAIAATAIGDTGTYTVVVTSTFNGTTTTTTTATGGALRINVAPTITTQPAANATIVTGTALTLTVAAATGPGSSAGTLSYQWRKNGTPVTTGTGGTTATYSIAAPVAADSGTYTVVITRTLNGTTTTTTSTNANVHGPVGIMPGSFVFRVTGADKPYSFVLPAGVAGVEEVKLSIVDIRGRNIWAGSINPAKDPTVTEITWNGRTSKGVQASAGMYVVRIAVRNAEGATTTYVRKSVSLKP